MYKKKLLLNLNNIQIVLILTIFMFNGCNNLKKVESDELLNHLEISVRKFEKWSNSIKNLYQNKRQLKELSIEARKVLKENLMDNLERDRLEYQGVLDKLKKFGLQNLSETQLKRFDALTDQQHKLTQDLVFYIYEMKSITEEERLNPKPARSIIEYKIGDTKFSVNFEEKKIFYEKGTGFTILKEDTSDYIDDSKYNEYDIAGNFCGIFVFNKEFNKGEFIRAKDSTSLSFYRIE